MRVGLVLVFCAVDWQDDDTPELARRLLGLPRLGDYTPEQMAEVFRCYPPEQTAEAVDWIRKQTPVCLGAGKLSFPSGSHQPITLEFDEADLLELLIDQGGTAKTAELQRVADNPSRIFAQMLEGNPAVNT